MRFAGLSGLGWLLDFTLLIAMVQFAGVAPGLANMISSIIAAASVFLVSRQFIYRKVPGTLATRLFAYVSYTILAVLLASFVVHILVELLRSAALRSGFGTIDLALATALAKILVTPPQLLMNFAMSRLLSERARLRQRDTNA